MKRNILLFALVGLLTTSCIKDGDFDALNNPMTIHGTIDPVLGVPIASGSVTVYDLLNMVQLSTAKMEVGTDDVITIAYDTTFHEVVDLENSKHPAKSGRKSGSRVISSNLQEGGVNIDLFDNLTFLNGSELEVDSLLVYFNAYLKATTEDSLATAQAMQQYNVMVYYNNISLIVDGQDGSSLTVVSKYNTPGDSISVNNLLQGENVLLFNNEDISNAVNMRPKRIRYSVQMNIEFTPAFFSMTTMSEDEFVADSIGIKHVNIDGYLKAKFPIAAYIKDLSYPVDIDMELSTQMDNLTIDSSHLYLRCLNAIPFQLALGLQFVDGNNQVLCTILTQDQGVIAGADVDSVGHNNRFVSTGEKESIIDILITESVYNNLMKAKKLRLNAMLKTSTPAGSNPANKDRVTVTADDKLSLQLYMLAHPTYTLDFDLDHNDNDEKGGVR